MKVYYATQILSSTVASGLRKMVISGDFKDAAIALKIADFVHNMNDFFDLFNSSCVQHPSQFKQAFQGTQYQLEFLSKIKDYLSKITIFNKAGVNISNRVKVFK